ncbi:MAG: DUF1211 domain-containing protein [Acidobacteria bacterium]|nr:DUF1211 domain-containing protein [Acidobacteriota bacterium]
MSKNRLEAFSDGVLAIIITIMVLELKRPEHPAFSALAGMLPVLLSYVMSFIYVGIYWNNHHHMFHAVKCVNGNVLWANLHLLFWLSLFPFATAWIGESHLAPAPIAAYGAVLLMAAIAYYLLQCAILADRSNVLLAEALGKDWKGKASPIFYLAAIPLAYVNAWIALGLYGAVAAIWLIPDRRIERTLGVSERDDGHDR